MILVVDNYDSFTYNLVQYSGGARAPRRGACATTPMTVDEIAALPPAGIVISPGPGSPAEAGI